MNGDAKRTQTTSKPSLAAPSNKPHLFSTPKSVRRVFERFPVVTYTRNNLPQRSHSQNNQHTLYIFTNSRSSSRTNFSCNPACLKWQTYLIIHNVRFSVKASNNHASPSGSLPFLLPLRKSKDDRPNPIVAHKIPKWLAQPETACKIFGAKEDVYAALLDQNIRNAWLYYLYLDPLNFEAVATPLYVTSASSNVFVHMAIKHQLKIAAREELLNYQAIIDKNDIYELADSAFQSLAVLLAHNKFFSGSDTPGLFDASVFAYTHLLLDTKLAWRTFTLTDILKKYTTLLDHRNRLLDYCYR